MKVFLIVLKTQSSKVYYILRILGYYFLPSNLPKYLCYTCQAINILLFLPPCVLQSFKRPCHVWSLVCLFNNHSSTPANFLSTHTYACCKKSIIKLWFEIIIYGCPLCGSTNNNNKQIKPFPG